MTKTLSASAIRGQKFRAAAKAAKLLQATETAAPLFAVATVPVVEILPPVARLTIAAPIKPVMTVEAIALSPATLADILPVAVADMRNMRNPAKEIADMVAAQEIETDAPVITDLPAKALPAIVAADAATIHAAIYASTEARFKIANGPNFEHGHRAMASLIKPVEAVKLSRVRPVMVNRGEGNTRSYRVSDNDLSIVVTKVQVSKDVWAWLDNVTGESGLANNWHVENICRGRVQAHATASQIKTA
jgi:hypothetical protein